MVSGLRHLEAAYRYLTSHGLKATFATRINGVFEEEGIGWQMVDGQVVTRGPGEFERAVAQAAAALEAAGHQTPKRELDEARRDLSRRPEPDVTGTIQHCMAALECTARILAHDPRATLGEIVHRRSAALGMPRTS